MSQSPQPTYEELLRQVQHYEKMFQHVAVTDQLIPMDETTHTLDANLLQLTRPLMVFPYEDALLADICIQGVQIRITPTPDCRSAWFYFTHPIEPDAFGSIRKKLRLKLTRQGGEKQEAELSLHGSISYRSGRVLLSFYSPLKDFPWDGCHISVRFAGHLNSYILDRTTTGIMTLNELDGLKRKGWI